MNDVSPPASAGSINALAINVFLPGVGTLIGGGPRGTGVAQIVLFLVGALLTIFLVGIPLVVGAWVWGLVTGIQMMSASSRRPPDPPGGITPV